MKTKLHVEVRRMTIRERLMEALGSPEWGDLPDAAMVEVLLARLEHARASLFEARQALLKEGVRVNEMQEDLTRQIRELQTNPLAAVADEFYFDDYKAGVFCVSVHAGRVTLMQRNGRIDYVMQQIDVETYARCVTDQI